LFLKIILKSLFISVDTARLGCIFLSHGWHSNQFNGPLRVIQMQVAVTETRWIEVNKDARLRIAKAEQESLCVACMEALENEQAIRGCHPRCYQATLRAIHAGKFTEKSRLASGKLLEKLTPGRPNSNPVSKEASA
jgi:hypothetical protein